MSAATRAAAALLLASLAWSGEARRRAVLIDMDGVRRDSFQNAYEEGKLPNFERVFRDALWFDNASTVAPSVTMATQASIATGTPPSRHGVLGNQWYERDGGKLIDYMNANGLSCVYGFTVLAGPSCATGLGNRHLQAPTMYEAAAAAGLTSVVVYNQYWKGASHPAAPTSAEATAFLKGYTLDYRMFDVKMATRTIAELQAAGLPAILTIYFAGADGLAHKQGIASQTPYLLNTVDPLFGRILDTIEALDPEWRSNTLFILAADHGRTDVEPHAEDTKLLPELTAILPRGSHLAVNGGVGYVYLSQMEAGAAALAGVVESHPKLAAAVASVRQRGAGDSPRAGDLIITLKQGHYFNNPGSGSQHGSMYPDDLGVPLVLAIPGVPGAHVETAVRTTQIARTIADFVGFPMESADPALPVMRKRMASAVP